MIRSSSRVEFGMGGGVVYKNDEFLLSLGYKGLDAYLTDENGYPVVETVRNPNPKMLRFLLEWLRPEKWGEDRNTDVPQRTGVLVLGDTTKKPENSSAASVKARKWKVAVEDDSGCKTLAVFGNFGRHYRVGDVCELSSRHVSLPCQRRIGEAAR